MRILITGGAGFIGSHLAEELLHQGHEVLVLDNLSTGLMHNIEHLEQNGKFKCFIGDVEDKRLTEDLIKQCDQIYHLAAAVGVKLIVEKPTRTIETNIAGTEVILKLASRYRKKVLVTSTSEVYGKSTKPEFREDDDLVIGPPHMHRWAYAASKAVDEFLAMAYWLEKRLPTVIVRLFNTVGERQRGQYGMVIPRFVSQALVGEAITVYGSGDQTRCFMYVKDCVRALTGLMNNDAAIGKVFNVGNPSEISMNDLAARIKALTKSKSEILHIPYERAYAAGFEDMQRRVPNIDRIHSAIGFKPSAQLDTILEKVIEYVKSNRL